MQRAQQFSLSNIRNFATKTLVIPKSTTQSKNLDKTWSKTQQAKIIAFQNPRFEQTNFDDQPNPPSAMKFMESVAPVMVNTRITSCDGGGGTLGHPKVYINLDTMEPRACGYCGNKFQMEPHHH